MNDSGVNDQPAFNEAEGAPMKMSPGARLAGLREERGWTVEQVASQLNLAPRQILAIERDDYPALPGMAITRGFVRAYAKLLKVDAAPLLADLGGETVLVHEPLAPQKSLSTPFADSRLPSLTEQRPGISSKWVVGGLLIALLGVGIWSSRRGGEQAPAAVSTAVKEGVADMAGAAADKPPVEAATESRPAPAPGTSAPVVTAESPAPAPAPAVTEQAAAEAPTAGGKDVLQLNVREDSWIEIRRSGDNRVLLSRLVKAGESETVQVTEPVSVVVGNAAGVDANLRGAPLEMKASSKSNVARLTVK